LGSKTDNYNQYTAALGGNLFWIICKLFTKNKYRETGSMTHNLRLGGRIKIKQNRTNANNVFRTKSSYMQFKPGLSAAHGETFSLKKQ
jgi:hypothetical protein